MRLCADFASLRLNLLPVQNRILSIILLLCLTLPIVGMFGWLRMKKRAVRKEVKHKLIAEVDKSELVLFKFTAEETAKQLEWEHSKEFEYRNEMYDVVQTETHGDTTYYWCWLDYKETALNRQLVDLTALALNKDPQHQNQKQKLTQFLQHLFVEEIPLYAFLLVEKAKAKSCTALHPFRSWSVTPPSPPPQLG